MSAIAIIPARGGSKRIPRKNIRNFCGRPIIAWSIHTAQASGLFSSIVVSTDDDEIAAIAERCGAQIPFRRPAELADDLTPTVPTIGHAVREMETRGAQFDLVCCIYPTAPFVGIADLTEGHHIMRSRPDAEFVFPVTSYPYPIQRSVRIQADGSLAMFWPEHEVTRSQDLETAWHDAGQFYWGTREAFKTRRGFFNARCYPVKLPRVRVNDIDDEEDWIRAEKLFDLLRADLR